MSLRGFARGIGMLVFLTFNAAGAWILYSRYAIDHDMTLPPALEGEQGKVITSAGEVHTYADTSGEGRPILFVHSLNAVGSAYEMKPLWDHYRGQRPVYALDLPGFGLSDRPDIVYTPELFAEAINTVLNDVVGEPADVVSFSLGGEFAATATLENSDMVHTLTVFAPTGMGMGGISEIDDSVYDVVSFPLWGLALYDLLVTRPSLNLFLGQIFYGEVPQDYVDYAYLGGHQPGAKNAPLYFVSGQLFSQNIRTEVYENLDLPVLAIYGDDPNVSFENLPTLLEANPNWTALEFEGTRAAPHWDEFDATLEALEAHFSQDTYRSPR